ncbi:hypothetical protein D1872_274660 [compost metagenome]
MEFLRAQRESEPAGENDAGKRLCGGKRHSRDHDGEPARDDCGPAGCIQSGGSLHADRSRISARADQVYAGRQRFAIPADVCRQSSGIGERRAALPFGSA